MLKFAIGDAEYTFRDGKWSGGPQEMRTILKEMSDDEFSDYGPADGFPEQRVFESIAARVKAKILENVSTQGDDDTPDRIY